MTDGIIQKVFKKYHSQYLRIRYANLDYEYLFAQCRQELIAEIKKKRVWQWDAVSAVSLKDLIGDNE